MLTKNSRRRPKRLRRKNHRAVALAMLSCSFLVTAIVITARPSTSQSKPTEMVRVASDHDTVLVLTPTRIIARGEALKNVEFTKVKFPKSRLSGDYLSDLETYKDAVAIAQLPKYLPVPLSALSKQAIDGNAVAEGIPEGMRAITVRVDAESAVEGWARSGNFVDVIVIRSSKNAAKGLEAKVIAENIRILSAGRSVAPMAANDTAPKAPTTVTLLVSQENALKVKTAASIGKLTFSLRGFGDEKPTLATKMDQKTLLGQSRSIRKQKESFLGFARGPDGKQYVLPGGGARWKPARNVPTALPPAKNAKKPQEKKVVKSASKESTKAEDA